MEPSPETSSQERRARRAATLESIPVILLGGLALTFAVLLVAMQIASVLNAAGIGSLRIYFQVINIGAFVLWLTIADLRTRLHR